MNIEFLRNYCLSFRGSHEDVKWENDLCFCVMEKIFCVTGLEGDFGVSLKVLPEEFDELTARDSIKPAPYLARAKWIHLSDPHAFSKSEWEHYLAQSYHLIKSKLSKKLQRQIDEVE